MLITKLFRRSHIAFAKYFVFLCCYLIYSVVYLAISTVLTLLIVHYELNSRLYVTMVVMGLCMCVFYATIQFCIQLLTGNFVLAAVLGIAYRYAEGLVPYSIPVLKYTPFLSFSFLVNENLFYNIGLVGILCMINILCSFGMVSFFGKRFYS